MALPKLALRGAALEDGSGTAVSVECGVQQFDSVRPLAAHSFSGPTQGNQGLKEHRLVYNPARPLWSSEKAILWVMGGVATKNRDFSAVEPILPPSQLTNCSLLSDMT